MIIDTVVNSLQTTSKVKGSKMTINVTGSSFGFILENLYTNPHKAIVRELVCNAVDAHQAVGNTNPYYLQVPSKFDPTFVLRDFGPGLDEEEINKYLNTLYESSKGATNDQIGGFGLGSKSPFSLVPSFFLTSYKNGIEYKCFWYRDEEGIPVLKVQSTSSTTEPNGLKYIINFAEKDVDLIASACKTELFNFKLLPKFLSNINDVSTEYDIWEDSKLKKLEEEEEYTIYSCANALLFSENNRYFYKSPIVSIGGVIYRISERECVSIYHRKISHFIDDSSTLIINIPIGKLKLPSTREHVLETVENTEVIKHYIDKAFNILSGKMQKKYQEMFEEDFKTSPVALNIHNFYKFCLTYGYNPKTVHEVLYNNVSVPNLDDLGFISKESFDGHKISLSHTNYTSIHHLFSFSYVFNKTPNSTQRERVESLFYIQDVNASYRVVPRTSPFHPTFYANRTKTLFIYADARVPASWLYGIKDIDTYKAIKIIRPNPFLFNGLKDRIEEGFNFLSLFTSACDLNIIRASEITKPENHKAQNSSTTTTQAFSYYKYHKLTDYHNITKIFKQVDSNGKPIPFGLEYIDETEEVFYRLRSEYHYLPQHVRCYMTHFKYENVYVIEDTKEEEFLEILKKSTVVKKIHKVSEKLDLDLTPLFTDEMKLLVVFQHLLTSCNYNFKLFSFLSSNILKAYPYISQERYESLLRQVQHQVEIQKTTNSYMMYSSLTSTDLRTLLFRIEDISPYLDNTILQSAYSELNESTVQTFLETCLPPALKDYINISIKEK